MAKQTFTTGQVLTAAQMTSLQQTAMGGGAATAKTTSYVLVAADAGTVVQMNAAGATTITVNTALFSAGDSVQIQNIGAGVCTITAGTATVTTAGSLALSQWEGGQLYFTSTGAAIFFDVVQSAGMTNPMTTTGDTIYASSGSTPARLGIGTTGQVLTVASGVPSWATPASGGGMTLLSTTALSGSSTSVTSISGSYNSLLILVNYGLGTTTGVVSATLNSATTNYLMTFARQDTTTNGGTGSNIPINAGVSQQDSGDGSICTSAINVYNYASTTNTKPISFSGNFRTGTSTQGINGGGTYFSTSAITSFQMTTSAGTLEGSIRIYGIK